jgi:hypothetical protein
MGSTRPLTVTFYQRRRCNPRTSSQHPKMNKTKTPSRYKAVDKKKQNNLIIE